MSATTQSGLDRWFDDETVPASDDAQFPPADSRDDLNATSARDSTALDSDSCGAEAPLARRVRLPYSPFAKQREFHRSPAKYRLFGGAAGPGKSKALLMEAVIQANTHMGANTLLLRRTFPELESSLLLYFRRDVPRELYRSYNETKHIVTWHNGSTTRFGYSKSENDIYQYQGAEFLFIGIDELTLFTLKQWQFLTSRNRCPIPGAFPNMAGATNPGNIGHAWVKSLWIDKQPAAGMEGSAEYDPRDYDFISARVWDNPIYASDANYLKTLHSLPAHLRRAFLDGDWEVFAGQYFSNFDPTRHVERPEKMAMQDWWPRWISIDWGFEHPAAVYWHASAPSKDIGSRLRERDSAAIGAGAGADDTATSSPRQSVFTYREFVRQHLGPRDLAREIVERSRLSSATPAPGDAWQPGDGIDAARPGEALRTTVPPDLRAAATPRASSSTWSSASPSASASSPSRPGRERIDAIYLSPDAFARRTDEATIAEQIGDVLAAHGLPRPIPADNDRIGGWMLMYQMLEAGEWIVAENCTELIRTLPALVRDSSRVEDIEKMDGDDSADAARYGLKSRLRSRQLTAPPLEQRLATRVTSSDPTIRAIQARKAQLEEQRRAGPIKFRHRQR